MLKHLKYYGALYRHKVADEFVRDRIGKSFVGTVLLTTVFGGVAGLQLSDGTNVTPDMDAAANAPVVMEELAQQRQNLVEQKQEFENLLQQITAASRQGQDMTALETARETKTEALTNFSRQLVASTLLSDELSEQQRQDFLTDLDQNVVNMSSIGFEELDRGGDVMSLAHLREGQAELAVEQGFASNLERAEALAQYNLDHTPSGGGAILLTFMMSLLGLVGGFGGFIAFGASSREHAYNKPKKPTKTSHGMRH
ncbi:MAG: hypothetical protein EP349_03600 [Alphaproteobacteria bacterium]|nr:MAG: hypothetical protein EP349_03600 [Alphaproteobacteria bacterium]